MLEGLRDLRQGSFRYAMTIDGYDTPVELAAAVTIGADRVTVDFDGTSPASPRGINVPLAYTTAYTCFGLMCALAPKVPNNAGSLGVFQSPRPRARSSTRPIRPPSPRATSWARCCPTWCSAALDR